MTDTATKPTPPRTGRKSKQSEPRRCNVCRQLEKRMDAGVTYTTIAPHLGICADCINRYLMKPTAEEQTK